MTCAVVRLLIFLDLLSDVPPCRWILLSPKILSPFSQNTVFALFIQEPRRY